MPESPSSSRDKSRQRKFRWFLNLQNFEFEIEAVRSEISRLEELYPEDAEEQKEHSYQREVLKECHKLIKEMECALSRLLPRELLIWQLLFLVRQRMLLIVPFSELPAQWETLKGRLQHLPRKERGQYGKKKFIESVSTSLNVDPPPSEDAEREVRTSLIEVRKFLDDKVALELWIAFRLRRYSVMFLALALPLVAYLVADICILRLECLSKKWLECSDPYSVVAMIVAGSLGALVSALSSGLRKERSGNPPLVQAFFARPVIGGIAGLVVYFLAQAGVINAPYPAVYVVAIAFGFSERAFYSVLGRVAGSTESRVATYSRLG